MEGVPGFGVEAALGAEVGAGGGADGGVEELGAGVVDEGLGTGAPELKVILLKVGKLAGWKVESRLVPVKDN